MAPPVEAGARLDERGLDLLGDLGELDLLVIVEQAVLEDHLAGNGLLAALAGLAAHGHNLRHLVGDVVPVPSLDLGEVHHIVNLGGAVLDGVLGLEDLGGNGGLAEGEGNGGTRVDIGASKLLGAELGLDLVDGNHLEVIALGLIAQLSHVGLGGIGVQVGVVNEAREVVERVGCHLVLLPEPVSGPESGRCCAAI